MHHKRKSAKIVPQSGAAPAAVAMPPLLPTEVPAVPGPVLFANLSIKTEGDSFDTVDECTFINLRSNSVDWDDTLYDEN